MAFRSWLLNLYLYSNRLVFVKILKILSDVIKFFRLSLSSSFTSGLSKWSYVVWNMLYGFLTYAPSAHRETRRYSTHYFSFTRDNRERMPLIHHGHWLSLLRFGFRMDISLSTGTMVDNLLYYLKSSLKFCPSPILSCSVGLYFFIVKLLARESFDMKQTGC